MSKLYKNLANSIGSAVTSDFYGMITNDVDMPSNNVQKQLLATSDIINGMQDDINYYFMLNSERLDPISKNIFMCQNPLEVEATLVCTIRFLDLCCKSYMLRKRI